MQFFHLLRIRIPFTIRFTYTALNTLNISQVNNLLSIQWLDKYIELMCTMVVHSIPFIGYIIIRNFAPMQGQMLYYSRLKSVKLTFQPFIHFTFHIAYGGRKRIQNNKKFKWIPIIRFIPLERVERRNWQPNEWFVESNFPIANESTVQQSVFCSFLLVFRMSNE